MGKTPKYCVIASCGRMAKEGFLGLHTFPTDKEGLHKAWCEFVKLKRPNFSYSSSCMICSMHFPASSFSKEHMASMGDTKKLKRLRLKRTAIPTVQTRTDEEWITLWTTPSEGEQPVTFERRKSDHINFHKPRKPSSLPGTPSKRPAESEVYKERETKSRSSTPSVKAMKEERRRAELEFRRSLPDLMLQRATSETESIAGPPPVKVRITELNSLLTCEICKGYFIEATTITECLHTFCKTCLVKHVNLSLHCPTCDTLIHPSNPFTNMKLDTTKQDIVYKLVPGVEKDEKERFVEFYHSRNLPLPGEEKATSAMAAIQDRLEGMMRDLNWTSVAMDFVGSHKSIGKFQPLLKRYLRVPVTTTISHIQKYVSKKLHLGTKFKPVILVQSSLVHESLSLEAIRALFYSTRPKDCLIVLRYGIIPCDFLLEEATPEPIVIDLSDEECQIIEGM